MATHNVANISQFTTALAAAVAGDYIVVAAGTYSVTSTGDRFGVALNPTNDGTLANPIRIIADGVVTFTQAANDSGTLSAVGAQTFTDSGKAWTVNGYQYWWIKLTSGAASGQIFHIDSNTDTVGTVGGPNTGAQGWTDYGGTAPSAGDTYQIYRGGPVIGSNSRDHVIWTAADPTGGDKWVLAMGAVYSSADTGLVVLYDCTGCKVYYADLDVPAGIRPNVADNFNAIRLEQAIDYDVANNSIDGFVVYGTNAHNGAGVMTYSSRGTIQNNTITGCGAGVYIKGETVANSQYAITIRKNRISASTSTNVLLGNTTGASGGNLMYQNVLFDPVDGAGSESNISFSGAAHNWTIYSNTADGGENGIYLASNNQTGFAFRDNLVTNITGGTFYNTSFSARDVATLPASGVINYNNYFGSTRAGGLNGVNYALLAAWQLASSQEANTTVSDPGYTNAAGNVFTLTAYTDTGSSTGGVRGAYINGTEVIGVDNSQGFGEVPASGSAVLTIRRRRR